MSGLGFGGSQPKTIFEFQNLDYLNADLTRNEWYTPFPLTDDVKVYYLIVEQTNNAANLEDIEVRLTVDGNIGTILTGMFSGQIYYHRLGIAGLVSGSSLTTVWQLLALDADQSAPLETRSFMVEVRQTSAIDVVAAQIEVNMVYATLEVS